MPTCVVVFFSFVIVLELQSFSLTIWAVANQTVPPGASNLGFSLWPRSGGRGGEKQRPCTGGSSLILGN